MSHTDRHRPVWVQELDPAERDQFKVFHDHRKGACDLHVYYTLRKERRGRWYLDNGPTTNCFVSYWGRKNLWGNPRKVRELRQKDMGRRRSYERTVARKIEKARFEDVEDIDVKNYNHRHNDLWEASW